MSKNKRNRTIIGPGPACPRCKQISQIVRHGEGKTARDTAYCKNPTCVTKAFPVVTKRIQSDRIRVPIDGPPCPRCQIPTTVWKHSDDWKPPAGKGYYTYWYQCKNDTCLTEQIMPQEAKVAASAAHLQQ